MKFNKIQVRATLLGEFIEKILEKTKEGYVFDKYQPYRLGCEYLTDMHLAGSEGDKTVKLSEELEVAINDDTSSTGDSTELEGHILPDWEKLDKLVADSNKDAIEDYCKPFGIDLSKRKSPANMLKDFKKHVGA